MTFLPQMKVPYIPVPLAFPNILSMVDALIDILSYRSFEKLYRDILYEDLECENKEHLVRYHSNQVWQTFEMVALHF